MSSRVFTRAVGITWLTSGAAALYLFLTPGIGLAASDFTTQFDEANKLYEQGKFTEATQSYEALLTNGHATPTLFYNLGNAYYKAGQNGRAIAAYRQAQQLTPRDPSLSFNLEFVRKKVTGFETSRTPFMQRILGGLTINEWTILAACVYWLWFLLLALREFRPNLKVALRGYTATVGVSAGILATCLAAANYRQSTGLEAVVVVPNAVVRNGPLQESQVSYQAPDGSEVTVLDEKEVGAGEKKQLWLQVRNSDDHVGWLQRDQVTLLTKK